MCLKIIHKRKSAHANLRGELRFIQCCWPKQWLTYHFLLSIDPFFSQNPMLDVITFIHHTKASLHRYPTALSPLYVQSLPLNMIFNILLPSERYCKCCKLSSRISPIGQKAQLNPKSQYTISCMIAILHTCNAIAQQHGGTILLPYYPKPSKPSVKYAHVIQPC